MLHTKNQLPRFGGGGGQVTPFFLHISSSWVKIRLLAENHLPRLPGSALKVCVGWGGEVGCGGVGGFQSIMWSHQLRLRLMLGCDNLRLSQIHPLRPSHTDQSQGSILVTVQKVQ